MLRNEVFYDCCPEPYLDVTLKIKVEILLGNSHGHYYKSACLPLQYQRKYMVSPSDGSVIWNPLRPRDPSKKSKGIKELAQGLMNMFNNN